MLLCPKVIIMIIRKNICLKHSMNMTFFYQCTGTQGCWNQHLLQQSQAPREKLCADHQDALSILKKVECPLLWFYQLCKICLHCVRISADLQWHIIYMILVLPFKMSNHLPFKEYPKIRVWMLSCHDFKSPKFSPIHTYILAHIV